MNEAFQTLSKTDGVVGVVVFDDHGGCLVSEMPAPYEPILLFEVLKRFWSAFAAFSSLDNGAVTSFCLDCEEGSVVVRRVDHHWVLALTHSEVNMAMLNVAMNVVVLNMSRSGQPSSGTQRAARASSDSLSRSIITQSMSSDAGDQEIPPDAVDRALLQQLVVIYQEYMGPAAKAVLKQQLAALGVTSRTLRRGQFGDLTARLASKIPVVDRQREFTSAVQKFRERMLLT